MHVLTSMSKAPAMRTLLLLALALPCIASAQPRMPATTRADLAHLKAMATAMPDAHALTAATQGRHPTALINGRCMVGFLARVDAAFDPAAVASPHVQVGARVGDVVSLRVDATQLGVVDQLSGISYMELAGKASPQLDRVLRATRADSVQQGIGLPQSYTGREVLIGVLDWGFDYTHPNFMDTALTQTRIRAAWDQFKQAGPAPAPFHYGSVYLTPDELMAAQCDTANIYSYATHGSHVAGIAGGSGAGTAYRGIAFDAQFLFCTFLVDAAAVIDAFAWMKQMADNDGKPLVVNMSWGLYHIGTLDGNSLISQAIDALTDAGVLFVNSGGNNGDVNFHIRRAFSGDTIRSRVQFYPYSAHPQMWGQSLSMWGEAGGAFSAGFDITDAGNNVLLAGPWYHTATQAPYVDSILVLGTDTVFFNLAADAAHPLNGRPHFRLRIKNTNTALRIALKATAPEGVVHFWNVTELSNDVGNWGQAFLSGAGGLIAGNALYGISEPACTQSLISVAAYNSEYQLGNGNWAGGAIAGFSSSGPTLDERVKPDIAAPGVNVASSISSFTDNSYTTLTTVQHNGRTYPFARFSGTSMSSPAVAGIAALVWEAAPGLTPAQLKALLMATTRTDQYTGAIPEGGSTRWGMGKVNAYHAVTDVLGVTSVREEMDGTTLLWPNPAHDRVHVLPHQAGPAEVTVTDMVGRVVYTGSTTGGLFTLNCAAWAPGVHVIRLRSAPGTTTLRFVKQ